MRKELELRQLFDDRAVLPRYGPLLRFGEIHSLLSVNDHLSLVFSCRSRNHRTTDLSSVLSKNASTSRSLDDLTCGPFDFSFYVFDLSQQAPVEYRLDPAERRMVRDHRIYLYRDGVRVLPYGDVEDDWLQLDVIRAPRPRARVLSNDQTVGFVYITQEKNPLLQDKTNREGLLDSRSRAERLCPRFFNFS